MLDKKINSEEVLSPTISSTTEEIKPLNGGMSINPDLINKDDEIKWMKSWILSQIKSPIAGAQYWMLGGNRSSSSGTGSTTFTPGFEAKLIRMSSTDTTNASLSVGASTGVGTDYALGVGTATGNRIVWNVTGGVTKSSAYVTSITTTDFTIEWLNHSTNTDYILEVFG